MTGATSPVHDKPKISFEGQVDQFNSSKEQFSKTPKPKREQVHAQTSISNEGVAHILNSEEDFDPAELKLLPVLASDRSSNQL